MKEKTPEIHPLFFDNPLPSKENIKKDDDSLNIRLYNERIEIKQKILDLSKRIKDISYIHELQVDVYSERQVLLERYHYLATLLAKQNAKLRKLIKKRNEYYSNEYQFSTTPKQKDECIKADLSNDYDVKEELENQIKYISGSMSTIDNIIFGIKHRIDIEEYRRRM